MTKKKWAHDGKLTEKQKEKIRQDFRDFSGGYHPGEAGEEHIRFVEEYADEYGGDDVLDSFLTAWGEEESAKDSERMQKARECREADFKKKAQRLASSFVKMSDSGNAAVLAMEDPSDPGKPIVFRMPERASKTEAKADAADLMWAVQLLLERGAKEWKEA